MFGMKNKGVQIKLVDTKETDAIGTEETYIKTVDPAEIVQIATEYTLKTVGAIGAVIAANKVLTTICDVVVITAKAKIK